MRLVAGTHVLCGQSADSPVRELKIKIVTIPDLRSAQERDTVNYSSF